MLVSWDWLNQYMKLEMTPAELAERLMMAGLNHEETHSIGDDLAIDLEVTSNRPDCLGHLGIAREIAVLWNRPLNVPAANPRQGATPVGDLAQVHVESPRHCPRYTARVIRGARVAPSPKWLVNRLATVGIATINNVVDVTNYVLMESGQPLHAFNLAKLADRRIIVRQARAGEEFLAINHKTYVLDETVCVIADARRAVGLGGVMGGAETEVTGQTTELLIESAQFDPLSIRNTARKLNLHSDSSYRFERGLDPEGVDWASRRTCELILELAGGELAKGSIDVGEQPTPRAPVALRFAQLRRVLGIDIPPGVTRRILAALGNRELRSDEHLVEVVPPSWRRDLTREIDLVEEVARIHGYDKIPEDVSVPMAPSHRTRLDRVLEKVRHVVNAAGFDEAMTLSLVEEDWSEAFSPWTDAPALRSSMPVLRRADRLRRSLVPSLLGARQINESLANPAIELFEIAHVYLPRGGAELPSEELMLGLTSGGDYFAVKGLIEGAVATLNPAAQLEVRRTRHDLLDPQRAAELRVRVGDARDLLLGYLGEVAPDGLKRFELRSPSTIAEIKLSTLLEIAELIPQYHKLPAFPAVARDLNLVVDEQVRWSDMAKTVQQAATPTVESICFQDVYRDPDRLGAGKKSLLFTLVLRSSEGTLTNDEADQIRSRVVEACQTAHGAQLRA
ncbi:MAG TPA: phenylalanine--tRNA ligase subunit beta [Pirellulales bacterium]|jgi:phenylalanyl-tRNA synthetase beta chain|nr:phenylalanine--tRNA ligase subunit beta [Pirellulales bacterium]